MPEAQHHLPPEEKQSRSPEVLRSNVDKLKKRSEQYVKDKYGISEEFSQQLDPQKEALKLCEKAIEALATDYVTLLTTCMEATDAIEALEALEKSEVLWYGESLVIARFDIDGEERRFLATIREQTYRALENRLETAAGQCSKNPSPENVALCLGVLGVMDNILDEFGERVNSPARKRFRDIARSFL